MKTLGIIPARQGSKRLKNKNMLLFNGMPLVVRAMKTASECLDHTIVSMDSQVDIYTIEDFYEWKIDKTELVKRPMELAQDTTPTEDVILHHLKDEKYKDYDVIVLLQCTSPLFDASYLKTMLKIMEEKKLPGIATMNHHYKFNGSCIIVRRTDFERQKTLWVKGMAAWRIDFMSDIDDLSDFVLAEAVERGDVHGENSV